MNANELADELERFGYLNSDDGLHFCPFQAQVNMLRQQQAEIEALKNAKRFIQNFAEEQHHRACQLEEAQEADNEPVAFMHKTISSWVSTFIYPETKPDEWLPLYTHPVKELTDEEIRTIQAICHLKNVGYDNFIMRFARAILKKAQEK